MPLSEEESSDGSFHIKKRRPSPIEKNEKLKIVLLGSNKVGKANIITKFVSNSFKTELDTTIKTEYFLKTINLENENRVITFELWDPLTSKYTKQLRKIFMEMYMLLS